jgi:RNase adapter protein RapZ
VTVASEAPAITSLEDFVVITGFSGAGKSTAMNVFEDAGYFCVDNLPPEMIRGLVDLFVHEGSKVRRAAVVSDVRARELFETLSAVLDDLARRGVAHRVLFLDADEDTLLGRYKETRRRHPLSPTGSVAHGIANERDALQHIKARADLVLDTSGIGAATLRRRIADEFLPRPTRSKLAVTLTSFGHKHGLPRDADIVLDMRFLPNPHWVP